LLNAIIRNAKRLQKLTEDILDVTRIESQSLRKKYKIIIVTTTTTTVE
jgi:K+-sensing histidine kinase KdpD